MVDSSESKSSLQPYTLPSLGLLGDGARSGIVGGLQAGAVAGPLYALFTFPWAWIASASNLPGRFSESVSSLVEVLIWACFAGAAAGLLIGFVTGVLTYFVITPWIAPQFWPEMRNATQDGMRVGAALGAAIAGIILGLLQLFPYWAVLLNHVNWDADFLLLIPLGLTAGGFLMPVWKVVVPVWRGAPVG